MFPNGKEGHSAHLPNLSLSWEQRRNWLSAGVAAGGFLACRMLLYVLCFPAGALPLWWLLRRGDRQRRRTWFLLGMAAAVLWVGVYSLIWFRPALCLWDETEHFQGIVTDYPEKTRWSWSMEVRLRTGERGSGIPVLMYTTQSCRDLKPGDQVELEAELCAPGETSSERFRQLAARGIFARTKTVKAFQCTSTPKIPLRFWPKVARKRLQAHIMKQSSPEEAGLLLALLTGETEELGEPLATELSRSGLRHIAAVSGLHVGMLTGALLLLPGERRVRQLLAALGLAFFCLVTGAKPPVVRATVMGLTFLLAPFFRRDADSIASVRTALLLLVLQNPYSLLSVSLQLSFASVLGILLLYQPLCLRMMGGAEREKREKPLRRLRRGVCESLALSLSALAFTTPLTACCFGTISLVAPLSNLLCLWAVELFFLGGALGTLLGLIFPPVELLWMPFRWCFGYIRWMTTLLARAPLGAVTTEVGWYCLWLAAVYGAALLLWRRPGLRRRWGGFAAGLAALFVLCVLLHRGSLAGTGLGVEAVDVGQGQSILLLSHESTAAVDCGGSRAGNALADAMNDAVESRLDLLVLTHFDEDHINGLEQLLKRVKVVQLVLPDVEDDSGGRARVEKLARAHGVALHPLTQDETFSLGEMRLRVFAPVEGDTDNNSGLSVLAEKEDFSVLITGDMDQDGELALARREALGPVSVLVAGHHGSRGSTGEAFLRQIQPKTVILSCGADNRYGHPHQETLERLAAAGCTVRRTDREGRVSLSALTR